MEFPLNCYDNNAVLHHTGPGVFEHSILPLNFLYGGIVKA